MERFPLHKPYSPPINNLPTDYATSGYNDAGGLRFCFNCLCLQPAVKTNILNEAKARLILNIYDKAKARPILICRKLTLPFSLFSIITHIPRLVRIHFIMEMDYMENLARAYRESMLATSGTNYVEEALSIVTKQLAVIAELTARTMPKNSALGYLQTLKMDTYTALIALLPKEKSPVPYMPDRGNRSGYNYLINTQIELFYVLGKIKAMGTDTSAIERNEDRAFTAIVAMKG